MASVHLVRCYCVATFIYLVVFSFRWKGKVVLGWVADRYGCLNILWACTTMSAMSVFCLWAPASTGAVSGELTKRALFITYVILYGITSGTYVSLLPPVIFDIVGPVSHYHSCCRYTTMKPLYHTISKNFRQSMVLFTSYEALGHWSVPRQLVRSSKVDIDQVLHLQRASCMRLLRLAFCSPPARCVSLGLG